MEEENGGKQGTDEISNQNNSSERINNVSVSSATVSTATTTTITKSTTVFNPYAAAALKKSAQKKATARTITTAQKRQLPLMAENLKDCISENQMILATAAATTTQSTNKQQQQPRQQQQCRMTTKENTSTSCNETRATFNPAEGTAKGEDMQKDDSYAMVDQPKFDQSLETKAVTAPTETAGAETEESASHKSSKNQYKNNQRQRRRGHGWGNVPPWERLPSNNVTFGPAEILSVSELRQHYSLYSDRSVRITGVLLHRYVVQSSDDDNEGGAGSDSNNTATTRIVFILGDPLELSRISKVKKNPYTTTSTTTSKVARPMPSSILGSAAKAPLLGKPKPALGGGGRPPSILRSNSKLRGSGRGLFMSRSAKMNNNQQQPRVILKKKMPPSISNNTSRLLSGRKRSLSSATSTSPAEADAPTNKNTASPLDTMVSTLLNKPSILIMIHPSHVHTMDCKVGDLVMVMGEVASWSPPSTRISSSSSLVDLPSSVDPLFQHWSSASLEQELEKKKRLAMKQPMTSTTATTTNNTNEPLQHQISTPPSIPESSKTAIKDIMTTTTKTQKIEKDRENNAGNIEHSSCDCYSYVKARITKNVNGTDMNLHQQALKLRRLQLVQLHHNNHNIIKNNKSDDSSCVIDSNVDGTSPLPPRLDILQGCGPPPYEAPPCPANVS